jgi:membrane peptidoglycan carboxypeptidase
VRTTIDPRLQQLAANVVNATLTKYGSEKHASQAALIAMRPDGAVLAMVGGRSYADSQYNRAVQAQRQPGSAFSCSTTMLPSAKALTRRTRSSMRRSISMAGILRTTVIAITAR